MFIILVSFWEDRFCIVLGEFSVKVVSFDLLFDNECFIVLILIKVDMCVFLVVGVGY